MCNAGQFAVVGKRLARLDSLEKVSGQALYVADLKLSRMLRGKFLRSPLPHALVVNVDISRAIKLPGVRAVITGADVPRKKFGNVIQDQQVLATDKVRYGGEPLAAVAAEDEDTLDEALQLIQVELQELPAVYDPEEALAPGAPVIHQGGNLAYHFQYRRGDPEEGLARSDRVFEAQFITGMAHHCYLEPRACLASPGCGDKVTLWGTFQSIFHTRRLVASALGLEEEKVRVMSTYVGGAFGGKDTTIKGPACVLLALKSGRPVLMANCREDEFRGTSLRVPVRIDQKIGVKRDGTLLVKETKAVADNGAYSGTAPKVLQTIVTRNENLYSFSHLKGEGRLVYTNKPPTGSFRGFGNPQGTFALESHLDEIAEELGLDPIYLRLKNAVRAGDVTAHGFKITSCGLPQCLQEVAKISRWESKRAQKKKGRGLGVACAIHVSGNRSIFDFDGSSAFIKLDEEGKAILITGESEIGQGSWSTLAAIAAEELGLNLSDIRLAQADTEVAPFCLGAYASRVTVIGGKAVRAAAADAKQKLLKVASELLEASPEDLVVTRGTIYVRGVPERSVSVKDACKPAIFRPGRGPILGLGIYDVASQMPDKKTLYGNLSPNYPFSAQVAEVEVDESTGQVKVVAINCADDIGRAINPMAVEGQVQGCLAQGIGTTLFEEMVWEAGHLVNASLGDYKIAAGPDMPLVNTILVETDDPAGPFGAKSGSEAPIVPTAAAIANAIYDATGIRIRSFPITPERLLLELKSKRKRTNGK